MDTFRFDVINSRLLLSLGTALLLLVLQCAAQVGAPINVPTVQPSIPAKGHLIGQNIPKLKMMKRLLRNFQNGRTASITAVFRSDMPVDVRWYREDKSYVSHRSELSSMLPIPKGDKTFVLSEMKSGSVTASTVAIPNFIASKVPLELELVVSAQDGSQQYQLKTIVHGEQDDAVVNIDSPEWMVVPRPERAYRHGGSLVTECKVFVPNEQPTSANELRNYWQTVIMEQEVPKIDFSPLKTVHKMMSQNHAERHGSEEVRLLEGSRQELVPSSARGQATPNHVIYDVRARESHVNQTHEGIYQCVIERPFDRAYVSSATSMQIRSQLDSGSRSGSQFSRGMGSQQFGSDLERGGEPKIPSNGGLKVSPQAEIIPCDRNDKRTLITIRRNQEKCIRCRGFGNPRPEVAIYKGNVELKEETGRIAVFRYVNVPDAAVAEATYLIRNPTASLNGQYSCKVSNDGGSNQAYFQIKYRR